MLLPSCYTSDIYQTYPKLEMVEFPAIPPPVIFARPLWPLNQGLSMANSAMKEAQANPWLAFSLAKFPAEMISYSYYLLLATLWYPCTKVHDNLVPLLRLPNKDTVGLC